MYSAEGLPIVISACLEQLNKANKVANFKNELRSVLRYRWESWHQAAQYCLANDVELEQGLEWVNAFKHKRYYSNMASKLVDQLNKSALNL